MTSILEPACLLTEGFTVGYNSGAKMKIYLDFGSENMNYIERSHHVSVLPDQRIELEPRVLTAPFEVSANTLEMMDSSVDNMKKGKVSPALGLPVFDE